MRKHQVGSVLAVLACALVGFQATAPVQAWGGLQINYASTDPWAFAQPGGYSTTPASGITPGGATRYGQPNSQASMMALWKHDVNKVYGGYYYGGPNTGGLGSYFTSPYGANLYGGAGVWRPF